MGSLPLTHQHVLAGQAHGVRFPAKWVHLGLVEGCCKLGVVVEGHEVGAGAGVGFYAVDGAPRGVVHEVEAQLARGAGVLAEPLHPLPDLHTDAGMEL